MAGLRESVRVIIYVPEDDAFIMVYDLTDQHHERKWRPVGGEVEEQDGEGGVVICRSAEERRRKIAAVREIHEEVDLEVEPDSLTYLTEFYNSRGYLVTVFFLILPRRHARHARSKGDDVAARIPREALLDRKERMYQGVTLHIRYRRTIVSSLPFFEPAHFAARA